MAQPLRVGIAGLGTVGAEVARLLDQQSRQLAARSAAILKVVAVTARSKKKRDIDLRGIRWAKTPLALAKDSEVDCLVELMGGAGEPALSTVEAALKAGKSVVTANKALIAKHGTYLASLAEAHGGMLNFEAAVGGAIPIIKTLREGFAGNSFHRVYGILNGTCNYILTRMEREGLSFDAVPEGRAASWLCRGQSVLRHRRPRHRAEARHSRKPRLRHARVAESAVHVEGISTIAPEDLRAAEELGYRVKLLGVAVRTETGIEQRVHPTMIPRTSSIAQVMGVTNAVTLDGDGVPPVTLVGPGAGGAATAAAVVADIADVARGTRVPPFGIEVKRLRSTDKAPMKHHEGGYYIRLLARDLPGTVATIATRLAEQNISIESIVQRHSDVANGENTARKSRGKAPVPVILITYATSEDAVRRAIAAVQRDRVISGRPQVIRIEKN